MVWSAEGMWTRVIVRKIVFLSARRRATVFPSPQNGLGTRLTMPGSHLDSSDHNYWAIV